jgi:hypothetical protein
MWLNTLVYGIVLLVASFQPKESLFVRTSSDDDIPNPNAPTGRRKPTDVDRATCYTFVLKYCIRVDHPNTLSRLVMTANPGTPSDFRACGKLTSVSQQHLLLWYDE